MAEFTPRSGSKRFDLFPEAATRGVVRSALGLRQTSKLAIYAEDDTESEGSDRINVGSSSLLENVDSEVSNDNDQIRCKCKHNVDDQDRAYVCCDGCGFWSHMECYGVDQEEDEEDVRGKDFLCQYCKDRSEGGDVVELSDNVRLPIRKTTNNPGSADSHKGGRKSFDVRSYYPSGGDLSVKKPKRVSFDVFAKPPSPEGDGDEDGYRPPSDEAGSEFDEEADDRNEFHDDEEEEEEGEEEDENSLFVKQPRRQRLLYQKSSIPIEATTPWEIGLQSPTPTGTAWNCGAEDFELAKTPRAPGVTDLGEDAVRRWIGGGYDAELDTSRRDHGSDTESIEVPDMSEGENLLQKLAAQDRLIFTLKKKLEQRGGRIGKLKQEVQVLRSEREICSCRVGM
jgi:hypothetical protein